MKRSKSFEHWSYATPDTSETTNSMKKNKSIGCTPPQSTRRRTSESSGTTNPMRSQFRKCNISKIYNGCTFGCIICSKNIIFLKYIFQIFFHLFWNIHFIFLKQMFQKDDVSKSRLTWASLSHSSCASFNNLLSTALLSAIRFVEDVQVFKGSENKVRLQITTGP